MQEQTVSTPPRERRRFIRRKQARSPQRQLWDWLLVLLTIVAILATVTIGVILLGERDFALRIYPHISVRGVSVGGMNRHGARQAILQHYAAFLHRPVHIQYHDQTWYPSAEDLGLQLDVEGAIDSALTIGRSETRSENLQTTAAVWEYGVDLPLQMTIDQPTMQRYLLGIAASVDLPPTDADIALEGTTIRVQPEAWGIQVLVDEMLNEITATTQSLQPQSVALRTRTLEPRVRDSDIAPTTTRLQTLLAGPITLTSPTSRCAPTCRWEWTTAQIAEWISLQPTTTSSGRPAVHVNVDQSAIRTTLLPIASTVREEGTLPRVAWSEGTLRITKPGNPGRGLDADQMIAEMNNALNGGERSLLVPFTPLPPPVNESNLASLGITQRIGLGVSSFAKSEQYRITNIQAGARRMNGILIPPGASFSFNNYLGPVTAEYGFVEGYAIVDNRTQKEWGGGLCQVSTTVFRAAFWSGLPITERHEHSFRIGWYEELGEPPGFDAAIFTGVYDLRFTNDTGGWLLMQSGVDLRRQRLSIAIYGPATGRSVSMSYKILERTPAPTEPVYIDDPKQPAGTIRKSDTARSGLRVNLYRTVRTTAQVLRNDTFKTTFKPWPDIYVRGTGR